MVVPTRNRSGMLLTTLRSVLQQRGVDLEVIVVDEASTDDTPEVLAAIGDPRVHVIRHDAPQGLSAARNHGTSVARGDWLAFIDDDDLWAPDKLVRQLEAGARAGREWVYTGSVNIENARIVHGRRPLPPEQTVAALRRYNAVPGGGSNVVWRRETWLLVGPFDTRFRGGEDWDMWIRLSKKGLPAWVCSPLVAKRVHATNMFHNIDEIVRATKLIETLHQTQADWGKMHRWLADRCLRTGRRRAALQHFAKAAVRGQAPGVAADLGALVRRRLFRRLPRLQRQNGSITDEWRATAAAWLREFEPAIR